MLQARDIRFSYSAPVLKGVSFDVGAGELLALLGPNGSGKSTLMKIISRILEPQSGEVRLEGRVIGAMPRRDLARLIGYVPQESVVRFPLTAMEFALQGRFAQGRLIGFESDEDLHAVNRAMELTETIEFATRRVGELSGGERQRVMLARALATRPRLLVLDEPVANLDISHQVKLLELVRSLTASEGISAVVVTHELNLAAEFASRVMLLGGGEVMALGTAREVMTEARLREAFGAEVLVDQNPLSGAPRVTLVSGQRLASATANARSREGTSEIG